MNRWCSCITCDHVSCHLNTWRGLEQNWPSKYFVMNKNLSKNLSLPQVFKPPRMPASMPCPRSSLPSAIRAKIWLSSSPWNMNRTLTVEEATLKCLTAPWIRRTCMASPLTCSCSVRTSLLIKKKKKNHLSFIKPT